jgi:hypothetical protein
VLRCVGIEKKEEALGREEVDKTKPNQTKNQTKAKLDEGKQSKVDKRKKGGGSGAGSRQVRLGVPRSRAVRVVCEADGCRHELEFELEPEPKKKEGEKEV